MTTITLSKPIQAHGETLAELQLREPTIDDVAELGYPFLVVQGNSGGGIEIKPGVVLKYASRLAAVPPSSLKTISIGDLNRIQAAVMGFFEDGAETPPA